MTTLRPIAAAALLLLAACGGEKPADTAAAPAAAATENEAQRAARIALALQSAPTKTDSVLAANGLTTDQLEQLMYKVAQDSTLSAEYGRLTNR
jgi:hypothetical protein